MNQDFITELIKEIKKKKPKKELLARIKVRLCRKHGLKKIPTDIEVFLNIPLKEMDSVKKYLLTRPTLSISGVSICAVMSKPHSCPHEGGVGPCSMCPGGPASIFGDVPRAYTGKEPATRRAIRNHFDPYLQVMNRLEQHVVQGHFPDKLELIIMGGTFNSLDKRYQDSFVKYCFKAMNDFSKMFVKNGRVDYVTFKDFFELPGDIFDKARTKRVHKKLLKVKMSAVSTNGSIRKGTSDLEKEQVINETSDIRCISLVIETRSDCCSPKDVDQLLKMGCTKVELGVQTIYDDVLKKVRRGHGVTESIDATRTLKDSCLKINYHMMLGLPGVTREMDVFALHALFEMEEFQPDMLKIYPCMVLQGTKLYMDWKKGKFKPISTKEAASIIVDFKRVCPEYVRIMRVQRDIPTYMTEDGVDKTNLRQYVEEMCKKEGVSCACIRCREPKLAKLSKDIQLLERHYLASEGNEFFISMEDVKNGYILGFVRLRFPGSSTRSEITDSTALIREIHVYGEAAQIGKKGKVQHKGIGKELMKRAEETAKMYYKDKMVVISAVGAREYFRKIGYHREGPYMVKKIGS